MITIYDVWALLITGIVLLLVIIVTYPLYYDFKYSKGKNRRIGGEIIRDLGLALLVGAGFKFSLDKLEYYVLVVLASLMIYWGVIMKEDGK